MKEEKLSSTETQKEAFETGKKCVLKVTHSNVAVSRVAFECALFLCIEKCLQAQSLRSAEPCKRRLRSCLDKQRKEPFLLLTLRGFLELLACELETANCKTPASVFLSRLLLVVVALLSKRAKRVTMRKTRVEF